MLKWAFRHWESCDIGAAQALGRQSQRGEVYRKKQDLAHVTRHKLKQEAITKYSNYLNLKQKNSTHKGDCKKVGGAKMYKEMERVLGQRQHWRQNLVKFWLKARGQLGKDASAEPQGTAGSQKLPLGRSQVSCYPA